MKNPARPRLLGYLIRASILSALAFGGAARVAAASPAPPTLMGDEHAAGYIKIADLNAVLAKLEAYAGMGIGSGTPLSDLRLELGKEIDDPGLSHVDLKKGACVFFLRDGTRFYRVLYVPIPEGAAFPEKNTRMAIGDHLLIADTPDDLAFAAGLDGEFRSIQEEAPMADLRVSFNMDIVNEMGAQFTKGLSAIGGGALSAGGATPASAGGEAAKPAGGEASAEPLQQIGALGLDIHFKREGVELQFNVFPKANTPLAAMCKQAPTTEFPMARLLPGGGAIRAYWRVSIPSLADAFEPDGAFEMAYPNQPMGTAVALKMKDESKANTMAMNSLTRQAAAVGVPFEEYFKVASRMAEDTPVNQINEAAALQKAAQANPAVAALAGKQPQKEVATINGHMLFAAGSDSMDSLIKNAKNPDAKAAPLSAQSVFTGPAQAYADIDGAKLAAAMAPMMGMMAPLLGVPLPAAPTAGSAAPTPIALALSLTGAAGQLKIFLPVDLLKTKPGAGSGAAAPMAPSATPAAPAAGAAPAASPAGAANPFAAAAP